MRIHLAAPLLFLLASCAGDNDLAFDPVTADPATLLSSGLSPVLDYTYARLPTGESAERFGCFGDVDGDGDQDWITGGWKGSAERLLIFNGGSTLPTSYSAAVTPGFLSSGDISAVSCPGDLDGDGYDEVFVQTDASGDPWHLMRGSSSGLGTSWGLAKAGDGKTLDGGVLVAAGDVDSDGYEEIWQVKRIANSVTLHAGTSTGITAKASVSLTPGGSYTYGPADVGSVYHGSEAEPGRGPQAVDTDGDGIRELYLNGPWFDEGSMGSLGKRRSGSAVLVYSYSRSTKTWTSKSLASYSFDGGWFWDTAVVHDVARDVPSSGKSTALVAFEKYYSGASPSLTSYGPRYCTASACTRVTMGIGRGPLVEGVWGSDLDEDGKGEITWWSFSNHLGEPEAVIHEVGSTKSSTFTNQDVDFTYFQVDRSTQVGDMRGLGSDSVFVGYVAGGPVWLELPDDLDDDGYGRDKDCDDDDASVYPGATETAGDGINQDCDGKDLCYEDEDGDGFGVGELAGSLGCTDPGEASRDGDCDDSDPDVYPSALELPGDGTDSDCDGTELCGIDQDHDGFRRRRLTKTTYWSCRAAVAFVVPPSTASGDCDDLDASRHPGAPETHADGIDSDCDGVDLCRVDLDRDGWADPDTLRSTSDLFCTSPGWMAPGTSRLDCDDEDATVHPGATEIIGSGVDEDCDGEERCYADADLDGTGVTSEVVRSTDADCTDPGEIGEAGPFGDCDDTEPLATPGRPETWYDGIDGDCLGGDDFDQDGDGFVWDRFGGGDCDDVDASRNPSAMETWYDGVDADCDGADDFDQDGDGWRSDAHGGLDCDDADPAIHPGAEDAWYDGIDSDCVPRDEYDQDGDGHPPPEHGGDDCNDEDPSIYPGALELPGNGLDEDCDGFELCYRDMDLDGFRASDLATSRRFDCAVSGLASATMPAGDCDPWDASVYPGADEIIADGIDQDCDGWELCFHDEDGDGFPREETLASYNLSCTGPREANRDPGRDCDDLDATIFPGAPEADKPDGIDQDCDGTPEEAPGCSQLGVPPLYSGLALALLGVFARRRR